MRQEENMGWGKHKVMLVENREKEKVETPARSQEGPQPPSSQDVSGAHGSQAREFLLPRWTLIGRLSVVAIGKGRCNQRTLGGEKRGISGNTLWRDFKQKCEAHIFVNFFLHFAHFLYKMCYKCVVVSVVVISGAVCSYSVVIVNQNKNY